MDSSVLSELFFDDNYSIENLLQKTRQFGLSLGELRQILTQYQQDLNQNSLELFNNNYDRFYELSYKISCLNEPIQRVSEPIVHYKEKVLEVCKSHDEYLDQINDKLHSLEDTSKNKESARRLIELIKRRDRLEEQVSRIDWSIKAIDTTNQASDKLLTAYERRDQDIEFQTKCDHLERISVELYHLINGVQSTGCTNDELIPIKKALEVGLVERQSQVDKWFEDTFLESVELQDKTLINLIVRTYRQRDSLDRIDSVWRNRVVRPYLSLTVTESQLAASQIVQTYKLLSEFLQRNVELVGGKFIVQSFWLETIEALSKMEKLYSLDNLDTFKLHYEETRRFLNLQDHYIDDVEPQKDHKQHILATNLVRHNNYKILNKFNLKGYFNHRLSQIASSVESSLTSNPLSELVPQATDISDSVLSCFKIKICMHIYVLITKCWSSELYIDTLELSFVQLACRILNRFADWLGKLRLTDFRITGGSTTSSLLDKQTNFLAKQDAIMRLLLEDCDQLDKQIRQYFIHNDDPPLPPSSINPTTATNSVEDTDLVSTKKALILESLKVLNAGLGNVRSLQRLIER